jgi:hypothetical protein
VTGELHFQVHPCGVAELFVDPLPAGAKREGALYPNGTYITNLEEVRELLYKMQRPGIAPNVSPIYSFKKDKPITVHVYSARIPSRLVSASPGPFNLSPRLIYMSSRREKDLVLFHNRGVLHTVVGAFKEDQVRAFHQCNLAASEDPVGPSDEDVNKWA